MGFWGVNPKETAGAEGSVDNGSPPDSRRPSFPLHFGVGVIPHPESKKGHGSCKFCQPHSIAWAVPSVSLLSMLFIHSQGLWQDSVPLVSPQALSCLILRV